MDRLNTAYKTHKDKDKGQEGHTNTCQVHVGVLTIQQKASHH